MLNVSISTAIYFQHFPVFIFTLQAAHNGLRNLFQTNKQTKKLCFQKANKKSFKTIQNRVAQQCVTGSQATNDSMVIQSSNSFKCSENRKLGFGGFDVCLKEKRK